MKTYQCPKTSLFVMETALPVLQSTSSSVEVAGEVQKDPGGIDIE